MAKDRLVAVEMELQGKEDACERFCKVNLGVRNYDNGNGDGNGDNKGSATYAGMLAKIKELQKELYRPAVDAAEVYSKELAALAE